MRNLLVLLGLLLAVVCSACGYSPPNERNIASCVQKAGSDFNKLSQCEKGVAPSGRDAGIPATIDLLRTGVPARAKIITFQDTGDIYNFDHVYQATVEVYYPRGSKPYRAQIIQPFVSAGDLGPGLLVTVRVDPKHPSHVAIK